MDAALNVHPRFKDRLAKLYVERLIKLGNEPAKEWATRFLKPSDVQEVAKEVVVLLRRRGFKIPE